MMHSRQNSREHGSVLVLALLVTLVVLGIGLTAMWVSTTGTKVSSNLTRRQEGLYAAETGLGRARSVLRQFPALWNSFLQGCGASMDDIPNKGAVLCLPGGTPQPLQLEPVIPVGSASASENPDMTQVSYTIYVRNDRFEYQHCNGELDAPAESAADSGDCNGDGTADAADADMRRFIDQDGRIVVRVEGHGKDGLSQVAIEATVSASAQAPAASGYAQKGGAGGGGANAAPTAAVPVP
jgi:Tfp pilus assembly protein PilX